MATLFQEAFLDSHQVAEIVTPPLSSDSPWTHLCHHLYHLGGNCLFTCLAPLNRWPPPLANRLQTDHLLAQTQVCLSQTTEEFWK